MLDTAPTSTRLTPSLPLDSAQRTAMEKRFGDRSCLVDYLRRVREDHGPEFILQSDGQLRYDGCRCRDRQCRHDMWAVHCADLIAAYTSKCGDLAAETARHWGPLTVTLELADESVRQIERVCAYISSAGQSEPDLVDFLLEMTTAAIAYREARADPPTV